MSNSASEYISATGIRMYKSVFTLPVVIYFEQFIQREISTSFNNLVVNFQH